MEQRGALAAASMIDSLTGWWQLAGVDSAVAETPVRWLDLDVKPESAVLKPQAQAERVASALVPSNADWPRDIAALKLALMDGSRLPGTGLGPKVALPTGLAPSDVMVISDHPDEDEIATGHLSSGVSGLLLQRMLSAIGIALDDCYWTALATSLPATGALPEAALPELGAFARHQISLAKPKALILLGDTACRVMMEKERMELRGSSPFFNHEGGMIPVLTTFHPRTLHLRPSLKAQAWKDLQAFAKRGGA